jgi:hypothetical protein
MPDWRRLGVGAGGTRVGQDNVAAFLQDAQKGRQQGRSE